MQGDCERCRAIRLLPFAAAADEPRLTLKSQMTFPVISSMPSRGISGRQRSLTQARRLMTVISGRCRAVRLLHLAAAPVPVVRIEDFSLVRQC